LSRSEIYLAVEAGAASNAEVLEAALAAAPVACVVIEGGPQSPLTAAVAKPLIETAQQRGIAVFVIDDASLARITKADGVHLLWSKDIAQRFSAARGELGVRFMIGADAGRSRHDAMLLGEAGADYVAFGIPPHVGNREVAEERQLDLIDWWSEIFEIPCVAFDVTSPEQAAGLCEAGADFISIRIGDGMSAREARERVASIATAVAREAMA